MMMKRETKYTSSAEYCSNYHITTPIVICNPQTSSMVLFFYFGNDDDDRGRFFDDCGDGGDDDSGLQ
jgi:hypothetical protein